MTFESSYHHSIYVMIFYLCSTFSPVCSRIIFVVTLVRPMGFYHYIYLAILHPVKTMESTFANGWKFSCCLIDCYSSNRLTSWQTFLPDGEFDTDIFYQISLGRSH